MKLKLERPLIIFDLETTGVDIVNDRIIEIAIVKVMPNGDEETKTRRINPECPIPEEATRVHGITDEDVKDCPPFRAIAKSLYQWIEGCDIAGFNSNRFDLPLLVEEFLRAGVEVDFTQSHFVDVQTIFHKMEPRNLEAALKFYCNKELQNAHSAEADAVATYHVLLGQLERYRDALPNDVAGLANFSKHKKLVDFAGRLVYDEDGEILINFGKYSGRKALDVLKTDTGYYGWIMSANFTLDTKNHFNLLLKKLQATNEGAV